MVADMRPQIRGGEWRAAVSWQAFWTKRTPASRSAPSSSPSKRAPLILSRCAFNLAEHSAAWACHLIAVLLWDCVRLKPQ